MFSSCSLAATSSMGEAIEMMNFVDMRHEEGTGADRIMTQVSGESQEFQLESLCLSSEFETQCIRANNILRMTATWLA